MKIMILILSVIYFNISTAQIFDMLKDYNPGSSITYEFTRNAYPSSFFNDTTSTIDIFSGSYRVYSDSNSIDLTDSVSNHFLTIHKFGLEIVKNRNRIISSRDIDTIYNETIKEYFTSDFNSGKNRITGWFFPDTVYQSPRCWYDSTIFYPYNYYYRYFYFPSVDTFDIRGDSLVLTNVSTDCLDNGATLSFRLSENDGILERKFRLFNYFSWSFTDIFTKEEVSGINKSIHLPELFSLEQNFPNPFNPTTKIKFSISELLVTTLKIYDVLGKEVATLVNEEKPAGEYEVEFNATGLPSSIYFYQLRAGSFVQTRKMVLMK